MFDTVQQRSVAALSGAPVCECWARDNRIYPLPTTIPGVLAEAATRHARGYARVVTRLARVWLTRVPPARR